MEYTVITPAIAPVRKVVNVFWGTLFAFEASRKTVYDPMRTAEVAACFIVVVASPLYKFPMPFSATRMRAAWKLPLNRFWLFASSMRVVLRRSVGVTATTLSTHPAKLPARTARPAETLPFSSARACLMVSKVRKRTPALNAVPYISNSAWLYERTILSTDGGRCKKGRHTYHD